MLHLYTILHMYFSLNINQFVLDIFEYKPGIYVDFWDNWDEIKGLGLVLA